ncbi:ribonuclease III [Helicobacter sp. 23-1044]
MRMGKTSKIDKKRVDLAKDSTNCTSNCHIERSDSVAKNLKKNKKDSANRKKIAESKNPISQMREDKSQSLPLPNARGGLRGWVDSANAESKRKNGDFIADSANEIRDSAIHAKSAESTSLCHCEARSAEAIQKNNNMDCHDFAMQNLAMTKKTQKIAESNAKKTHPLTPSAREGEDSNKSPLAREGGQNIDSANQSKITDSAPKHTLDSASQNLKNPHTQGDIFALQKAIKYHFKDENLLRLALTHKSFDKRTNNERLEFLGDAVMDLIIGEYAFKSLVRCNEGDLTRIRAAIVNENSFANLANRINLGTYLFISHSESRNKGRKKPSILSDAFEALIGAIYLDGGLESARGVALALLEGEYKGVELENLFVDYKTALQELTQAICGDLPEYDLIASKGPDHNKKFTMRVLINAQEFAKATGKSKKEAEQECAKIAYNRIKQRGAK